MRRFFRRILMDTGFWFKVPEADRLQENIYMTTKDIEGTKMDIRLLEHDIAEQEIILASTKQYLRLIENELDALELEAQA